MEGLISNLADTTSLLFFGLGYGQGGKGIFGLSFVICLNSLDIIFPQTILYQGEQSQIFRDDESGCKEEAIVVELWPGVVGGPGKFGQFRGTEEFNLNLLIVGIQIGKGRSELENIARSL